MKDVKSIAPGEGSILVLSITETEFANMDIILEDNASDVINTDARVVEL